MFFLKIQYILIFFSKFKNYDKLIIICSRWIYPVFITGMRKNRLDIDDLSKCSKKDEAQHIVQKLER